MHTVHARAIRAYEEEEVLVVSFPDDPGPEPKQWFMLQRHLTPNEDDIAMGHDRVHLSGEGNREGRYGGITRVRLGGTTLKLTLEPAAAAELKVDPEVEIDLAEVATFDRPALTSALNRVLAPLVVDPV